jgi:hypothetical protein
MFWESFNTHIDCFPWLFSTQGNPSLSTLSPLSFEYCKRDTEPLWLRILGIPATSVTQDPHCLLGEVLCTKVGLCLFALIWIITLTYNFSRWSKNANSIIRSISIIHYYYCQALKIKILFVLLHFEQDENDLSTYSKLRCLYNTFLHKLACLSYFVIVMKS